MGSIGWSGGRRSLWNGLSSRSMMNLFAIAMVVSWSEW
jgi:hypothetical protein